MTKPKPKPDPLRTERELNARLISKRADHDKHLHQLSEERGAIAYQAHKGSKAALARLDAIHSEFARADSERLALEAALRLSSARLQELEDIELAAQERARKEAALEYLPSLQNLAAEGHEALKTISRVVVEILETAAAARQTSKQAMVDRKVVAGAIARAIVTGLDLPSDVKRLLALPPLSAHERTTLPALITRLSVGLNSWANPKPQPPAIPTPKEDFWAKEKAAMHATVEASRARTAQLMGTAPKRLVA